MPRLFKPTGGKETLSERITRWVVRYPSLALGFLPIIGGMISTPMQIHEIERDQAKIFAWRRVALVSVLAHNKTAFPSATEFSPGQPLSTSLSIATGREPARVVEKHLQRIELMRRAVQHPSFNVRVARQANLQRGRALASAWARPSFFRQLRAEAASGRTEFALAKRRALNRRA